MEQNLNLTNNGINFLLNEKRINEEIKIDMYLQLKSFQIFLEKEKLYLCTMNDNDNIYNKFILKAEKGLTINDIIHIEKIRITIAEGQKIISCIDYKTIKYDEYLNRLKNLQKEKELEKKEQEIKRKLIEETNERKKLEEELNKKRKEEEINKKLKEEEELDKKRKEEELKQKKMEEELIKKQNEKEKNDFLKDELNDETKLFLSNLNYSSAKQRYNFKWEKGNLKWLDLSQKLSDFSMEEDGEDKGLELDLSLDTNENDDNKINYNEKDKEKQQEKQKKDERPIIKKEEENKIIENKEENEDKKEIEEIFKDVEIKELVNLNKKVKNQSKKLEQEFELIVNLSEKNCKKPIYVKCMKKNLLINFKMKSKYIYYLFRDSDGAEINAYTYGDYNVQKLDKIIQSDGVYIIFKYKVKPKVHPTIINGNYSLVLNSYTKIEKMPPDSVFNKIHFHFLSIDDLFFFKEGCIIDTCGVIYDEGEPRIYNMKDGQKFMRNVLIADSSKKKMMITLYEPHSKDTRLKIYRGEILAVKYGKIGITDTKIKKLNTTNYTILQNSTGNYNQDLLLKEFYEKNQNLNNFLFIFHREDYKFLKDINQIRQYNIEHNITKYKLTFITKACIQNISLDEDSMYKGCPLCSKKLIKSDDNEYECVPCNKKCTEPKYLFKLNLKVRDTTNSVAYFRILGIKATQLLEVEPDLVKKYLEDKKYKELDEIAKKVLFKDYIFTATLSVFGKDKNGKILHSINVNNIEKADGENLKRILKFIHNDDDE